MKVQLLVTVDISLIADRDHGKAISGKQRQRMRATAVEAVNNAIKGAEAMGFGHDMWMDTTITPVSVTEAPAPNKPTLFIPVGDSAEAFSTVACTVHFHDVNNPLGSGFPDVHTVKATVVSQKKMDKMAREASYWEVNLDDPESVMSFAIRHEMDMPSPDDPLAHSWLRQEVREYIRESKD